MAAAAQGAPAAAHSPPLIRFRLSHIDSVMSKEEEEHDVRESPFLPVGEKMASVPVIRIFGATDKGQRVVAHVHGAFPYVYVAYKGKLDPDSVNSYTSRLGRKINQLVSSSLGNSRKQQHVAFIVICKGTSFYGYHVGYTPFLKIYLTQPSHKSRVSECLRAAFQFDVYEDHVPFPLQFMLDANLYGCGWVELESCLFRNPLPEHVPSPSDAYNPPHANGPLHSRTYTELTVPTSCVHPSSGPAKISYCTLELDTSVSAILNRHLIAPRTLHSDYSELLRPESIERDKLVHSVKELWDDERRRRRAKGESGPEELVDDTPRAWDSREEGALVWKSEEGMRDRIAEMAEEDLRRYKAKHGAKREPRFEDYPAERAKEGGEQGWLARIRTTWEQVGAVFPETVRRDRSEGYVFSPWAMRELVVSYAPSFKGEEELDKTEEPEEVEVDEKAWSSTQAARSNDFDEEEDLDRLEREEGQEQDDGFWAEPEEEGSQEDDQELEGSELEERSPKRVKRDGPSAMEVDKATGAVSQDHIDTGPSRHFSPLSSSTDSPPPPHPPTLHAAAASPWFSSPQKPRKANPFASPDKLVRVRFADQPVDVARRQEARRGTSLSSASASLSPVHQRLRNATPMNLDDLPSDAFDYSQPSPTLAAPGPSMVPFHLRSRNRESLPADASDRTIPSSPTCAAPDRQPLSSSHDDEAALPPLPGQLPNLSPSGSSIPLFSQSDASVNSNPSTLVDRSVVQLTQDSPSTSSQRPSLPKPQHPLSRTAFAWSMPPPTSAQLINSIESFGKSRVVYVDPFFSNPADVPPKAREYAGRRFRLRGNTIKFFSAFEHWTKREPVVLSARGSGTGSWEWAGRPPNVKETREWLRAEKTGEEMARKPHFVTSQIQGPTQVSGGYNFVGVKGAKESHEQQHLDVLSMELHVNTRGKLLPNPKEDAIVALFYCLQSEADDLVGNGREEDRHVGVIAVGTDELRRVVGPTNYTFEVVDSEHDLLNLWIDKIRAWDPEIVAGYETVHASWGYLLERADAAYDWRLVEELGRVTAQGTGRFAAKASDRRGFNELSFSGRHLLPIWQTLEADNRLQQYTFENVAFHMLRRRVPHFSSETLSKWYTSGVPHQVARVFEYWRDRVEMDVEMLDEGEVISQTCESARVFGVDFKSVRTRGSQFKVESVMFRIAKPESFLLLSPNRPQVGKQNAAECQPLVMEPKSAFYKGPLVVLDFQSLYPSVMIGYNYCYSTCLGRIGSYRGVDKFGTTTLTLPPGLLYLLKDHINVSPNGFMFVKPEVRKSLLAKMLAELLDTRVMVKAGMKSAEGDKALFKLLNARQLALKFLANVTYGYTSATFSGRMPCVEIADAIVQTGRETLERAMETIKSRVEWSAEVVYGDTDSLFIYLPGKSKEDAFRIGHAMANTITSQNPRPIKLKFEKVYLPCVLLAKKRYVGFKYERETDLEPDFDAKGIETIRRDGFPAAQKMQETCLKILFRTSDLSLVKAYCQEQWQKLLAGNVSPQDFTYAKQVRLGTYSAKIPPPPGAAVATRRMQVDSRAEPEYGERVPYVLFQSEPGQLQVDKALHPADFVADPRLRLDAPHYIVAIIKVLERVFILVGADVRSWYAEMPQTKLLVATRTNPDDKRKPVLLDEHFVSDRCAACGGPHGKGGLCAHCQSNPGEVAYTTMSRTRHARSRQHALHQICGSCSATPQLEEMACDSLDCPVFYLRNKVEVELAKLEGFKHLL